MTVIFLIQYFCDNFKLCFAVSLSWSARTKQQKNVLMSKADVQKIFSDGLSVKSIDKVRILM